MTSLNHNLYRQKRDEILEQLAIATHEVQPGQDETSNFLEAAQAIDELVLEVIGKNEAPKPNPRSENVHDILGTCWDCYEESNCVHEVRDEFRAEQRAIVKGEK